MSAFNSPEYWHGCAAVVRVVAEHMRNPEAKAEMLRIVEYYEFLAQRAETNLSALSDEEP